MIYATGMIVLAALLFLMAANGVTILRFWQDKRRAVMGLRRVPEADLLGWALIGGSPGALFARQKFHHKTRKQPFSTLLLVIVGAQASVIVAAIVFWAPLPF